MKGAWKCLAVAALVWVPLGCGGGTQVEVDTSEQAMSQEEQQSRAMIQELMNQRNQANPYAAGAPPAQAPSAGGQ